uniref:Uncharacterized protein n=1 Tax=Anguilla anguilla TaxID=7936 RepID=A0A0E9PF36_ANGAN
MLPLFFTKTTTKATS